MKEPVVFFVFQKHSVFMPFKYLYPECLTLIEPYDQLSPLHCLRNDHCPVNKGCMDILAKRVNYLFTHVVPTGQQIIAYFKYRDRPNSIRAGVFVKDMAEPKLMTLNLSAFKKFQREGFTYTWVPPDEYMLLSPDPKLISVESLLVKPHER
jgi:hypothetical protein